MHLTQLPTLEEAIAAMAQEETRLKQVEKVESVPKPAYYVSNRQETRACHNCGIKGHLSMNCFAPLRGRGRYGRGNYGGVRGRNAGNFNYQGSARANMSTMDEGQSSSGQSEGKKGEQRTEANFGDFAHFVYSDEGKTESASIATPSQNGY